MIYSFAIDTPANTAATAQQETTLSLVPGIVHQVEFQFPPGPAGLLYVAVRHSLFQVWPTNPTEYFHVDDKTIAFKEFYRLAPGESQLTVRTYNLDDTYTHQVIVRLGILQQGELQGLWLPWTDDELAALSQVT